MSRRINLTWAALAVGLLCASTASATETITYTYDARGRLIKVVHTDTATPANHNNQVCYKYDKADNRTNVTATINSLPPCP